MGAPYLELLKNTSLSPKAVAGALGRSCRRVDGKLQTECPVCQSVMSLTHTGAVCSSSRCTFWTGDSLDYAAACQGGNYEAALDTALEISSDWLTSVKNRSWPELREELASTLKKHRSVLEFLMALRTKQDNGHRVAARTACRNRDIDPDCMPRAVYALTAEETGELFARVRKISEQVAPPARDKHVAFVFFRDPHRISKIELLPLTRRGRDSSFTTLRLFPSRFSFLGIHDARADDRVLLCQNFSAAARDNSFSTRTLRRTFRVGVLFDSGCSDSEFLPEAEALMVDADAEHLLTGTALVQAAYHKQDSKRLRVVVREKGSDSKLMAWEEFGVEWLSAKLMAEKQDRQRWMDWIESAMFDKDTTGQMLLKIQAGGDLLLVAKVRELFRHRAVVTVDKVTLYESVDGYYVKKRGGALGDGERLGVSNFIIEFSATLYFQETGDLFHLGKMHIGNRAYPLRMCSTMLDSTQALEEYLRRTVVMCNEQEVSLLPTVRERTNARLMLDWLKQLASALPSIRGVTRLGWDTKRKVFQGPGWMVTADGTKSAPTQLHPKNIPSVFTVGPLVGEDISAQVSPNCCRLVSRLAAALARGGAGEPLRPTFYADNVETREMLAGVFAGIGQHQPLDLLFGGEGMGQLDYMRTLPLLVSGLNKSQCVRVPQPLFVINADGENMSGEVPEKIAPFVAKVADRVLSWVFSGDAAKYKRASAVLYEEQLEREGEAILRDVLGLPGWPNSPKQFGNLEAWLGKWTPEQFEEQAALDAQSQLIWLPGAISTELELELRGHANHVERRQAHMLVDSASFTLWAENFYGRALKYRLTNLPEVTA